jgi:ribosome-binding factor A
MRLEKKHPHSASMARHRQLSYKQTQELCGQPGPEDGVDPRYALREAARKKGGRKTHQLCAQVARALDYALAAVCEDDVLRDLLVVAVQPAPDASRLLVTVTSALSAPCEPTAVLARLERFASKLRSEVAAAIHRKKAPELTFRVASASSP